jgi:hypothetical protein
LRIKDNDVFKPSRQTAMRRLVESDEAAPIVGGSSILMLSMRID